MAVVGGCLHATRVSLTSALESIGWRRTAQRNSTVPDVSGKRAEPGGSDRRPKAVDPVLEPQQGQPLPSGTHSRSGAAKASASCSETIDPLTTYPHLPHTKDA